MLVLDTVLHTPEEVAKVLKVNVRTVYRLIDRGQLKAVRVGDLWRIRDDSLREMLAGETDNG